MESKFTHFWTGTQFPVASLFPLSSQNTSKSELQTGLLYYRIRPTLYNLKFELFRNDTPIPVALLFPVSSQNSSENESQHACCGRSNQTNTPMFEILKYWPRHATSGCLVVASFVEEHFRKETRDRLLCTISSHSAFCIIAILDVAC